jgi:hypothetical protein
MRSQLSCRFDYAHPLTQLERISNRDCSYFDQYAENGAGPPFGSSFHVRTLRGFHKKSHNHSEIMMVKMPS